ncbi:hypothetical protein VPH35_014521 [Triticum aestivum]
MGRIRTGRDGARRGTNPWPNLPSPRLRTILTAWLRPREHPTPTPITPWCPARSAGQGSRGRARRLGGGIHRAAPPAPTRRSESSAGNARRPARAVQPEETLQQAVLARMGGVRAGVDSVVHHDVDGFSSPPSSAPLPVHQDEA